MYVKLSSYYKGHQSTPEKAHKSYESLVGGVYLSAEMFKNVAMVL